MMLDFLIYFAAGWALFATLYQVVSFAALGALLRRRPAAGRGPLPDCTFLRPLRGDDDSKEANLDDLCRFGIPIVTGVLNAEDPAVALVGRVQARHPEASIRLLVGHGPEGSNRKVANLIQILPHARGDILIFTDADVRLHDGSLEAILRPFDDAAVGLVTCPYRAVAGSRLVERTDAIANNTTFLPSVALAERIEGVRFALGACIALRRKALDAIGGLDFLLDMLPDDYALAAAVRKAGYELVLAPVLLDHCVSPRGWQVMIRRHVRWARTIHAVRPLAHLGTMLTHGFPPALALAIAALTHAFTHGGGLALAMLALWLAVRLGCAAAMRKRLALGWLDLVLLPLVDLWGFVVLVASVLPTAVWWDDRQLLVGEEGRILAVIERDGRIRPVPGAFPQEVPRAAWYPTKRKKSLSRVRS